MKLVHTAAALAALTLIGSAWAQGAPGVTLYGQATVGLTHKTNQAGGASTNEVGNSQFAASLIGLRGVEDLGGGLRALFRIESGFNLDDGNAGATVAGATKFWNRQSFVGLAYGPAVTVTLGRQFHAATDRVVQTLDVYNVGGTSLAVTPLALFGVNRFVGSDNRVDNSIKLRLRGPLGLTGGASVGLDDAGSGRSASLDLAQVTPGYAIGAWAVQYRASAVIAATGARPTHTAWGLGGNLPVGPVRLYLHYVDSDLDSTVAGRRTQSNRIVSLGAAWSVLPTTTVKAAYTHDRGRDLNGIAARDGNKTTLVVSAEYAMSKRSTLHVGAFDNRYTDGYRLEPVNINALGRDPAAGSTQGLTLGLRHDF